MGLNGKDNPYFTDKSHRKSEILVKSEVRPGAGTGRQAWLRTMYWKRCGSSILPQGISEFPVVFQEWIFQERVTILRDNPCYFVPKFNLNGHG